MKNKYKSKPYAEYSIQFWFDQNGRPNLLETSNMTKKRELKDIDHCNAHIFARKIAESDLLDNQDKLVLRKFAEWLIEYLPEDNI